MKIKLKYTFMIITLFFCFMVKSNAMTLGGKEVNSPAYTSGNANTWYQFHVWGCDVSTNSACTFDVFDFTNSYTYVRACSDMSDIAFSSNYPISPSVIKTNEKCSFSTGYQGYITWIMYRNVPNILNIGNSSTTFYDPNPVIINLKSSKAFSFSAQAVYFSKEPLDISSGTSTEDITNNANWNTQKILDSNAVTYNKLNEQVTSTNALNDKVNKTNELLEDDNVDGAQSSANDFFTNFDNKDYGLSDIVSMPLTFINKMTSATCAPLKVPLPFVDTDLTLPCMYDIYQKHFGSILSIYQTITFGMIAYFICLDIFRMVKNFRDPDKDNIEVLDL